MKSKILLLTLLVAIAFLLGFFAGQIFEPSSAQAQQQLTQKQQQQQQQQQPSNVANIIGDLTTLKKAVILNYYQLQKNFALLNKISMTQALLVEDAKINYKLLQPIEDEFSRKNIEIDFEMKKVGQ